MGEAVWAQKCFAVNKHAIRTCHALYLQNAVHPEGYVFALTKADGFEKGFVIYSKKSKRYRFDELDGNESCCGDCDLAECLKNHGRI